MTLHLQALRGVGRACLQRRATVRLLLVGATVATPALAWPRDYGLVEPIDTSEELADMAATGELTEDDAAALCYLIVHPIDVNNADRATLAELPDMTLQLADACLAARPFANRDDLRRVAGMSDALVALMRPFAQVLPPVPPDTSGPAPAPQAEAALGGVWRRGTAAAMRRADARLPQGFVRAHVDRGQNASAGMLVTYRGLTQAVWRQDADALLGAPRLRPRLDRLYAASMYGATRVAVGSYNAGFGSRLTFDSTVGRRPRGWYVEDTPYVDAVAGVMHSRPALFGAAVSWQSDAVGVGFIDATLFASASQRDLHQHHLCYHDRDPDAPERCHGRRDCAEGYHCGEDGRCHSHRVLDNDLAPAPSGTLANAFRETLAGANVAYHWSERGHVEGTAYVASTRFLLATPAAPAFAPGANYPSRAGFGALGLAAAWGAGPVDFAGEYARMDSGGGAWLGRGTLAVGRWGEAVLTLRHFGASYDNPHNHADAAPERALGGRARNQQGLHFQAMLRPWPGWHWRGALDVSRAPHRLGWHDGDPVWVASPRPPTHRRWSQHLDASVTAYERVALGIASGRFAGDIEAAQPATRRRQLELGISTRRWRGARWSLHARWTQRCGSDSPCRFTQRLWLRAAVPLWPGARVVAQLGTVPAVTQAGPGWLGSIDWQQSLGDTMVLRGRYGLTYQRDAVPPAWRYQHVGKVVLEARL